MYAIITLSPLARLMALRGRKTRTTRRIRTTEISFDPLKRTKELVNKVEKYFKPLYVDDLYGSLWI